MYDYVFVYWTLLKEMREFWHSQFHCWNGHFASKGLSVLGLKFNLVTLQLKTVDSLLVSPLFYLISLSNVTEPPRYYTNYNNTDILLYPKSQNCAALTVWVSVFYRRHSVCQNRARDATCPLRCPARGTVRPLLSALLMLGHSAEGLPGRGPCSRIAATPFHTTDQVRSGQSRWHTWGTKIFSVDWRANQYCLKLRRDTRNWERERERCGGR
jgi:hypothetical protein